jgi:hypothetical protein
MQTVEPLPDRLHSLRLLLVNLMALTFMTYVTIETPSIWKSKSDNLVSSPEAWFITPFVASCRFRTCIRVFLAPVEQFQLRVRLVLLWWPSCHDILTTVAVLVKNGQNWPLSGSACKNKSNNRFSTRLCGVCRTIDESGGFRTCIQVFPAAYSAF